VRAHTVELLNGLGYEVVEAGEGAAALRVLASDRPIRLLLTDVGLPGGMNGRQLADEARRLRPDLRLVFMTGYAGSAIVHHGRLDPGTDLLPKPFTLPALAGKIRNALDA
jgi:CheY-like chemotaxis protein